MKFIFLALVLVICLAASVGLIIKKEELATHKTESAVMMFDVKDFPEHGVSLIAPSGQRDSGPVKSDATSFDPLYSVFLKNTSSRAVVGYSIKWVCFDGRGESPNRNVSRDRNVSNIVSWVFLHGAESDRRAAINASQEIIKPRSTWLISFNSPAQPIANGVTLSKNEFDASSSAQTVEGCASMTIIADGIFFDDGTFIGPDSNGFFTAIKSQMDARLEILSGVQNELKSGKSPSEIFKGLERIRDREGVKLGEQATADEFRAYFRSLFARDILGKKEVLGIDKAIDDVRLELSKPWVKLRKL